MSQNDNENNANLEIKRQQRDLIQLLERNTESITELQAKIDQNDERMKELQSNFQNWKNEALEQFKRQDSQNQEFQGQITAFQTLQARFEPLEEKLSDQSVHLQNLQQSLDKQRKLVTNLDATISSENEQISGLQEKMETLGKRAATLEENLGSHREQLNQHGQMLEQHRDSINDRPIKTEVEQSSKNLMDTLSTEISSLSSNIQSLHLELNDLNDKTTERLISTDNLLENLKKVLSDLKIAKDDHSRALEEQRLATLQLKGTLKELISQSKSDQKTHFENFNRIIESLRENIHTELTLTTQSLKKSDIEILNEVNAHYMRKKVGQDLQDRFEGLSKELEEEAKKTRDELIKGLQQSVSEYENIMEQQAGKISAWSQDLEQFQEEIMAIIERKVNEKYETVFSLLSQVVSRAEELALLIKTIEIQIPRSLPEITEDRETQVTDEIPPD
ncbi:MAG: hypothetical protein ACFFE8_07085 [Candidatus Heimdallarchaeota archaeon]